MKACSQRINHQFASAGLQQSGETFNWPIERGFDWLGYQFDALGLASLTTRALENHQLKLRRLYEPARRLRLPKEQMQQRVVEYRKRWRRWTTAGFYRLIAHRAHASNADQARPWDVMMPDGIVVK